MSTLYNFLMKLIGKNRNLILNLHSVVRFAIDYNIYSKCSVNYSRILFVLQLSRSFIWYKSYSCNTSILNVSNYFRR